MGVSIAPSGKGGKKPLDSELNLIPFIDLLIVNICFLLITAVWTQMSRIEVSQKGKSNASEKKEELPPERRVKITILVGEDGYTLTAGGERMVISKNGDHYDNKKLASQLRKIKNRLPKKDDLTVAAEDGVKYKHLIRAMDVALTENFTKIQVSDSNTAL